MSSKSKRGNKPPRRPAGAAQGAQSVAPAGAAGAASSHEEHDLLDDLIETPPGRSRWTQAFLIVLLIFLLIVFIVPFAVMSVFTSQEQEPAMTWEHPSAGLVELAYPEFVQEKRRFRMLLGDSSSDLDVAETIIHDAVAEDAGMEISDSELREAIDGYVASQFGGQVELYRQFMAANHPGGVPSFETTIRRFLRSRRWGSMIGLLATVPDPAEIEELWAEQHVEYRFDYVELAVEDVKEAVRADLPEDELESWFDGLQEWEKSRYKTPERWSADLAYYPVGTEPPAELLARYPAPEGEELDAEKQAEDYYNLVRYSRFLRPEPAEGEEPLTDRFLSLDEARDVAAVEAPIYYALMRWLDDVGQRAAAEGAEPIDLAAEASELGLAFLGQTDSMDQEGWSGLESIGGVRLASAVRRTQVDDWIVGVTAEAGALIVGRVTGKVEATLPPFEEFRDEVADAWVDQRAADAAVEQLAALRDGLEAPIDEEAFRTAAEAAGFTVGSRDWLDRAGPATADPDADQPAHLFLRGRSDFYDMEEGGLSEAALDGRREHAYLVRLAGSRPVDIAEMRPQHYQSLARRSAANARTGFSEALGSEEQLRRLYGLRWPRQDSFDAAQSDLDAGSDGEPEDGAE